MPDAAPDRIPGRVLIEAPSEIVPHDHLHAADGLADSHEPTFRAVWTAAGIIQGTGVDAGYTRWGECERLPGGFFRSGGAVVKPEGGNVVWWVENLDRRALALLPPGCRVVGQG